MCMTKKTLDEDHINEEPTYEDIVLCHQDNNIIIPMAENAAYGHIIRTTKIITFSFLLVKSMFVL